ncbi:MAG: DUF2723 domain-containing protein [Chloroflexi bacterium]|nr:DUF2723 domain-containing protein [Ardenticatenaceae bacterium]NOG37584.1 DUF2723 domain-containing protein [Chloroflexota bacterium]
MNDIIQRMWIRLWYLVVWLLPALALGLFSGRVASETWANVYEPRAIVAMTFTALTTVLALLMVRPHPLSETWPLLMMWGYALYPHPDPLVWTAVALLTAVCFAQMIPLPALPERWLARGGLVGTAVLFGALYLLTIAPGLLPADNGEFQFIAAQLGVAHPPGFPLYTLLAHLMTRLPIGDTAAYRVNLLSVMTSTAVLLLVYQTVWDMTKRVWASATAVLALGTATTFWAQATTANIRSLTALFAALALWALVRFYQETQASRENPTGATVIPRSLRRGIPTTLDAGIPHSEDFVRNDKPIPRSSAFARIPPKDRWLVVAALAMGLGVSHHLSLTFMSVVFVIFVVVVDPTIVKTPKRWLRPLLAALLGLLPLLYLPLRASTAVRGASADLATWSGFIEHVLGLGFQGDFFYFTDPLTLGLRLGVMGNILTFQFSGWLLAGMVIGLALLLWREWKLGLLFGLSFGVFTLITAMYRAPQTVEYMLPAYVPMVLCLGYTARYVGQSKSSRPLIQLLTASLFTAVLFQGWSHWPSYWQMHRMEDARDYAQNLLADAPPDALILANWHWATPLWYLQEVEGQRPDVTVRYVAPGADPYGETWAQEIAAAWGNGRDVIATWYDPTTYANLPPPEPLHEAFWFRQQPRTTLPANFTPLGANLGENIHLLGYLMDKPTTEIWQEAVLTLAWQPISQSPNLPISINAHLIGSDGRSYAQSDLTVSPQPGGITLSQFRLTLRPGAPPGDYAIRVGSGETSTAVTTHTVTPMSQPPITQHRVYRGASTARLLGYDWDYTLPDQPRLYLHWQTADGYVTEVRDNGDTTLPSLTGPWGVSSNQWAVSSEQGQHYVPLGQGIIWIGDPISNLAVSPPPISQSQTSLLSQHFTTTRPLWRDYVVSTRLVGYEADGFHWAWCDLVDYVPAMGAIPTLKWIAGSYITSPHSIDYTQESPTYETYCQSVKPAPGAPVLAVSDTAVPGQSIGGMVTLYDAFTQRPLPILDERITAQFPWIPLGQTTIAP